MRALLRAARVRTELLFSLCAITKSIYTNNAVLIRSAGSNSLFAHAFPPLPDSSPYPSVVAPKWTILVDNHAECKCSVMNNFAPIERAG